MSSGDQLFGHMYVCCLLTLCYASQSNINEQEAAEGLTIARHYCVLEMKVGFLIYIHIFCM